MELPLGIAIWVFIAAITGIAADSKGLNPWIFVVSSFMLPLITLIFVLIISSQKKETKPLYKYNPLTGNLPSSTILCLTPESISADGMSKLTFIGDDKKEYNFRGHNFNNALENGIVTEKEEHFEVRKALVHQIDGWHIIRCNSPTLSKK